MNASYKVALVAAIAICLVIIGVYVVRNRNAETRSAEGGNVASTTSTPSAAAAPSTSRPGGSLLATPVVPSTSTPPTRTPSTPNMTSRATGPTTSRPNATTAAPNAPSSPVGLSDLMSKVTDHLKNTGTAPGATTEPTPSGPATPALPGPATPAIPPSPTTLTFGGSPSTAEPIETPVAMPPVSRPPTSTGVSPAPSTPPAMPTPSPTPRPTVPAVITTPAPRPMATPPAAPDTYTIRPGDTLSDIAARLLGEEREWVRIAQANPMVDPLKLRPGQVIRLPRPDDKPAPDADAKPAAGSPGYLIRSGDTLSSIAQSVYGDSTQWRAIYLANRERIGPNPDKLQVGTRLVIPSKP